MRLQFDIAGHDRYGRLLAYVHAGDVFVNRDLVRRGLAQVAVYPPNAQWVGVLRAAADTARLERGWAYGGRMPSNAHPRTTVPAVAMDE